MKNPTKYFEKLHSIYFPFNWNEAIVSPERLLMINGKFNSPESLKSWIEKLSVFKEPKIEDLTFFDEIGRLVTSYEKQERNFETLRKQKEYFNEVNKTILDLGAKSLHSTTD